MAALNSGRSSQKGPESGSEHVLAFPCFLQTKTRRGLCPVSTKNAHSFRCTRLKHVLQIVRWNAAKMVFVRKFKTNDGSSIVEPAISLFWRVPEVSVDSCEPTIGPKEFMRFNQRPKDRTCVLELTMRSTRIWCTRLSQLVRSIDDQALLHGYLRYLHHDL